VSRTTWGIREVDVLKERKVCYKLISAAGNDRSRGEHSRDAQRNRESSVNNRINLEAFSVPRFFGRFASIHVVTYIIKGGSLIMLQSIPVSKS
jgi:hypothetical protein